MEDNKKDEKKITRQELSQELPNIVRQLDVFRNGDKDTVPVDISLTEFINEKYGLSRDEYLEKLGVKSNTTTISNLFSMPDQSIRWLVPEVIREAIYLGVTKAPFYPTIIASDQPVNSLRVVMPYINSSDASPATVNEAETIPLGTVSFGQKDVGLYKIGKGFKITDEVRNYVSLDVISVYLRDFGYQLGYAMDTLAINTLINGNMPNGAETAAVIGVGDTSKGITYRDLLRIWVRASRMGRNFTTMIGDEEAAIDLLDLPEFKDRQLGSPMATLDLKTPVPNKANFYIHPGIPDNSVMMLDQKAALIKLTAKQLMLESERIVSNQTEAIYASLTTGFAKMYRDAALLLDGTKAFTSNGFPDYMNIDPWLQKPLEH